MTQKLGMARQQFFIDMYTPAHVIIGVHLLAQLHIVDDKLVVGLLQIRHTLPQLLILHFVILVAHKTGLLFLVTSHIVLHAKIVIILETAKTFVLKVTIVVKSII